MKKIFTKIFLFAALLAASANLSAQTYNGGVWYSLYDTNEYSKSTNAGGDIKTLSSIFTPSTGVLSFETKMTGAINPDSYQLKVGENTIDIAKNQKSYIIKSASMDATASSVTFSYVYKFYNATRTVYVKNVTLPLAQHILLTDGQGSKTFDNVVVDGASAGQKVSLRSFLTNGNITVKSSDNAFRINSTSNLSGLTYAVGANACASANGSGAAGGSNLGAISQYDFTVYFCPTEAKEYSATITITDGTSTATISVSGTGVKKNQQIVWSEDYTADEVSVPVGKELTALATATSGSELTYSSDNESVVSVDGTTLKALAAGTATITVTQAGDEVWNAITATKVIKVTEKKIQYIHWTDNLTRLVVGGEPVQLTATAAIMVDVESEETQEAPERTALITYASADASVVAVEGNMLTIVGEGETTLTATLPGDDTYEAATVTMPVRVRVPSSACETYLLNAPDEVKFQASGNSYEPAELVGPAYQLTFEARIGNATAVGNLHVQQMVNGEWQDMDDFMPKTDWQVYGPYTLDRNATKVRFYSPYGSFNRFIKNVLVTQATYLETTTPEITVEQSIIGDEIIKTIAVQYSNIPEGVTISNKSEQIVLSDNEIDTDCGTYGEKHITLTITPTAIGTIQDTITIYEEITNATIIIPVTVHTQRYTQTIVWEDSIENLVATDIVTLNATAENAISYATSDSTVAYVNDANQLIIQSAGTVTITAHAAESETHEPAQVSKVIVISKATPVITTLPVVAAFEYGITLDSVVLEGGVAEVDGSFVWNTDVTQLLNAGDNEVAISFVPAANAIYAVVDTTIVVQVNPLAQTIEWNLEDTVVKVGDVLILSELCNAVATSGLTVMYSYSEDWQNYVTYNDVTDEVTAIAEGVIIMTANQDGLDTNGFYNYLPAEPVSRKLIITLDGVSTGVDNVQNQSVRTYKQIINGQIVIIRGGQMYDLQGRIMK